MDFGPLYLELLAQRRDLNLNSSSREMVIDIQMEGGMFMTGYPLFNVQHAHKILNLFF